MSLTSARPPYPAVQLSRMWTATFFAALLLLTTAHALLPRALGRRLFSVRGGLKMAAAGDFYSIVEKDGKGNDFSFEQLRGRVVYGVNVASKCGYTASGYALLEKISAMDGVSVLIAPCNQFGGQEPGSAAEIESFCALKGVKGATILEKADVNGAKTRPV